MDIKQDVHIWLQAGQKEDLQRGDELARRFGLVAGPAISPARRFQLTFQDGRLELYWATGGKLHGPVSVDFLSSRSLYRYRTETSIKQPLARAAGLKAGKRPSICDTTAGFGRDGFALATLGCRVHLVERSFPVWLLLEDGISRASAHPAISSICERITLVHGDARTFLASSPVTFDTIYLDPMYPPKKKSALNKQELRDLRSIVGMDLDSGDLLETARRYGGKRSVVKRPVWADSLGSRPDFSITGKSTRYDIYLANRLR